MYGTNVNKEKKEIVTNTYKEEEEMATLGNLTWENYQGFRL